MRGESLLIPLSIYSFVKFIRQLLKVLVEIGLAC
jgi:hypothetical protein